MNEFAEERYFIEVRPLTDTVLVTLTIDYLLEHLVYHCFCVRVHERNSILRQEFIFQNIKLCSFVIYINYVMAI